MLLARIWPGLTTEMTPSQVHAHFEVFVSAGTPFSFTVNDPGVHGVAVAGMHGCGVSTPCAAVVAAATCGLARLLHIPKLGMLTFGAKSATVHATVVATAGLRVPLITDGLAPIEHRNWDPVVTMNGITDHTAKHHPRAAIRGRAQGVSTDVHPRT